MAGNDLQRIQTSSYMLTSSGNPLQKLEASEMGVQAPLTFIRGLSYFQTSVPGGVAAPKILPRVAKRFLVVALVVFKK